MEHDTDGRTDGRTHTRTAARTHTKETGEWGGREAGLRGDRPEDLGAKNCELLRGALLSLLIWMILLALSTKALLSEPT